MARMVYLHTGTMGAHPACLLSFRRENPPPRWLESYRNHLSCFVYLTYGRAPTGGRCRKIPAVEREDGADVFPLGEMGQGGVGELQAGRFVTFHHGGDGGQVVGVERQQGE